MVAKYFFFDSQNILRYTVIEMKIITKEKKKAILVLFLIINYVKIEIILLHGKLLIKEDIIKDI